MATDPTNREFKATFLVIMFRPLLVIFMSMREGKPRELLGMLSLLLKRLPTLLAIVSTVFAVIVPQPSGDRSWQRTVSTQKYGHHALTPRKGLVMVADNNSEGWIYSPADPRDEVIYFRFGRFSISSTDTSGPVRVVIGNSFVAMVAGDLIVDLRDKDHPLLTQISGSSQLRPLPGSGYAVLCEQLRKACGKKAVMLYGNQQIETDERPRTIAQVRVLTSTDEGEFLTAWRRGYIEFSEAPLAAIARDFEQYYDVEFDIEPAIRSRVMTISGHFPTDPFMSDGHLFDPVDGLRQLLNKLYPDLRVTVHADSNGHRTVKIRLKPGHPG